MRLPFGKKKEPQNQQLSEVELNKRRLVKLVIQGIFAFMLLVTLIFAIVNTILGIGFFLPRTGPAVIESAKMPAEYQWRSESHRVVSLAGTTFTQDAFRAAAVDLENNKFNANAAGILPEQSVSGDNLADDTISDGRRDKIGYIFSSDGKTMIGLTPLSAAAGEWRMMTDICKPDSGIPATSLAMPSVKEINAGKPKIVDDKATVLGKRNWEMNFQPTPIVIEKLLWLNFFNRLSQNFPAYRPWVLSETERRAIRAGKYKIEGAKVWVNRDKPRRITKIDIQFRTQEAPSSRWRIMAQAYPPARSLANISIPITAQQRADNCSPEAIEARTTIGEPPLSVGR